MDPEGPKTYGSYRSGSAILVVLYLDHEGDAEDRGRQAGGEQVPHTALREQKAEQTNKS
jgi:hypothetical protein